MTDDTLEEIELKNGTTAPKALIATTTLALDDLLRTNMLTVIELIEKAKNKNYKMFGNSELVVKTTSLMEDGQIHESVKNIILSSFTGERFNLKRVFPLKEKLPSTINIGDKVKTTVFHNERYKFGFTGIVDDKRNAVISVMGHVYRGIGKSDKEYLADIVSADLEVIPHNENPGEIYKQHVDNTCVECNYFNREGNSIQIVKDFESGNMHKQPCNAPHGYLTQNYPDCCIGICHVLTDDMRKKL